MNAPAQPQRFPRLHDWQLRLEAFVRDRSAVPFAWGSNDCALFAADAVQALTGVRHLPELRGHASAREALRAVRQAGGLHAIATRALGPAVTPAFAAVGDVVLVRMGRREALGLCNGGTVLGPGPDGLAVASMDGALAAWRVG